MNTNTVRCSAQTATIVALIGAGAILASADFNTALVPARTISEAIDKIANTLPNLDRDDLFVSSFSDGAGAGVAVFTCRDAFAAGEHPVCVLEFPNS